MAKIHAAKAAEEKMNMRDKRPDELDEGAAFRNGFSYGQDCGPVSPAQAEAAMRAIPHSIQPSAAMVDLFCHGAEDGARGDSFRLLLSYMVKIP